MCDVLTTRLAPTRNTDGLMTSVVMVLMWTHCEPTSMLTGVHMSQAYPTGCVTRLSPHSLILTNEHTGIPIMATTMISVEQYHTI